MSAPLSRAPVPRPLHRPAGGLRRSGARVGDLVQLTVSMQVVNDMITPLLDVYVLVLANRRRVLGGAATGPVLLAVAPPASA